MKSPESKEIETVSRISRAVSKSVDVNEIFEMACRMSAQALRADRCSIGLLLDKNMYEIAYSYRRKPSYPSIQGLKVDLSKYPHIASSVRKRKPVHLFGFERLCLSVEESALFKKLGTKVFLAVPVTVDQKVLGALHLSKVHESPHFSLSEITLFQTIANEVALAIKNTRLVKTLKEDRERLRSLQQQALLANERLRFLMFSTSAVIYAAKTSGDYGATFITDNVQRMTGYDPKNFIKNSSFWVDRIHPEDKQRILQDLPNIFKKGYHTYEYRFRCKNGKYIWMRDEMKLIRDDKRQPLEIIGYWTDVTQQKQAEQELITSLEKLKQNSAQQATLLQVSKALAETLDLTKLFEIVSKRTADILMIERCAIMLLDEATRTSLYYKVYIKGKYPKEYEAVQRTFKDFPTLVAELKKKHIFISSDVSRSILSSAEKKVFRNEGIKSLLVIPFSLGGKTSGLLAISSLQKQRQFTESEIEFTRALGNQLSMAVYNARLLQDLQKKNLEQRILLNIGKSLSRASDLKKLFGMVTKEAADHLRFERSGITLVEGITGRAHFASLYFQGRHQPEQDSILGNPADFPEIFKKLKRKRLFCTSDIIRSGISAKEKEIFRKYGIKSILIVPFSFERSFQGLFSLSTVSEHHDFSKSEIRLSQAIANQLSVAVENARLIEVLRKRSEELKKLSLEVINAQEREKKNLAGKLHDLVAQDLSAVQLNLKLSKRVLPGDYTEILARLIDSEQLLGNSINSLRNLTSDLRPPVLDYLGLATALKWYVKRFKERTNAKITLNIKGTIPNISPEIASSIYRIIQEGLANVAKHSQASRATISIGQENHNVRITIQDNGIGFDADSPRVTEGYGLFRLRETVGLLGGKVEILSGYGKGTKLIIVLPWKSR